MGGNILKKGNKLEKRINKELHDKIVKIHKDIKKHGREVRGKFLQK